MLHYNPPPDLSLQNPSIAATYSQTLVKATVIVVFKFKIGRLCKVMLLDNVIESNHFNHIDSFTPIQETV